MRTFFKTGSVSSGGLPRWWRSGTDGFNSLLALLAGALASLSFAPFELWPLAVLSCLGFLVSVQRARSVKQAALRGWLYGVGFFGAGVSWVFVSIHQFGNAPIPLAALLTALFVIAIAPLFALQAYLFKRWFSGSYAMILLGFPALWVIAEAFRGWFLTGFPWLYLGYTPIDTPLAGWAPITGVLGLSGILALISSCLYLLPSVDLRARIGLLLLIATPFINGFLLQQQQWTAPSLQAPLRVALVQANIPQELKWNSRYRAQIIDQYRALSEPLIDRPQESRSELIIWPETAIPLLYDMALPRLTPWAEELADNQVGLISGIPYRTPPDQTGSSRYHNSIMGLGSAEGLYHKQRLVPFGEYVPLESWLRGLIEFFDLPMSNFSLGPANQQPLVFNRASGDQIRLSAYICYEIVYPDLVANNLAQSDLLLTISNDSWFGDSLAPHQHLQMARMRALETGRYLIRGTNNGISALIDHQGNILIQGPQFVTEVIEGEVLSMQGNTPFVRWGSLPVLLLCGLLLIACRLTRRRKPSLG